MPDSNDRPPAPEPQRRRSWWRRIVARLAPARGAEGRGPAVLLLKKPACPLCDEAAAVIAKAAGRVPFSLETRDISGDAMLMAAHAHEVPVVFINGRKRFFGHVDPVLFLRAVERP